MPRYAVLLAYDGTDFAGWWRQPDRRTVAAVLDAACGALDEPLARAVGASRTDAGVHARGQVAHLDCVRDWEPKSLQRALDRHLPADCVCRAVAAVAPDWHAVHAARAKTYSYLLELGPQRDPFLHRHAWRPPAPVASADLAVALALLPGEHDLCAFARRGDHRDRHRTTIQAAEVVDAGGGAWHCRITADRYSYRLARSLFGAALAVAQGACTAAELTAALGGERTRATAHPLPALGLCLESIRYDPDLFTS